MAALPVRIATLSSLNLSGKRSLLIESALRNRAGKLRRQQRDEADASNVCVGKIHETGKPFGESTKLPSRFEIDYECFNVALGRRPRAHQTIDVGFDKFVEIPAGSMQSSDDFVFKM